MESLVITGVQRTKKGRYSVYADGEFVFALHPDIFAVSHLKEGTRVSVEELEALRIRSEEKMVKDKAMRLLSAREYTSGGLRRKLREMADEDAVESAVNRMIELGLVNDGDYARRYAADCVSLKGFSLARTKRALVEKGVPGDIAESTVADMDEDPVQAVEELARRKYIRYLSDEKGVRRTVNAFMRLGYAYSDIRRALQNLSEDLDNIDFDE